jgi:hypothetical protein
MPQMLVEPARRHAIIYPQGLERAMVSRLEGLSQATEYFV